MTFNRPKWKDPDWCDRNVLPAELVDDEVIEAAARVHRYSSVLIDLLNEGSKRRLAGMVPIARQHLGHPDPFAVTAAVGVLEILGDASDVARLERLVAGASDHYLLAAILGAIVTLDPARWRYALEAAAAEREDGYFNTRFTTASVMVRLAEVLPDDLPGLDGLLIEWATDSRLAPAQQEAIFRRLGSIPRTERVEDFLVEFYNQDDEASPNLTRIVDEALGGPRALDDEQG